MIENICLVEAGTRLPAFDIEGVGRAEVGVN